MLAILDLCNVLLALPPLLYLTIKPHDNSFLSLCVFTSFIALGTAIASGGVLVIIAVDRYMKLCLLRKTGVGSMLSKQLFTVSVITACIINIPTMWIFGRDTIQLTSYQVSVSYCFIRTESKSSGIFLGWAAVLAIVFISITVALVYLYWCVVRKLRDLSDKHDELKRRPSVGVVKESLVKQKQSEIMRQSCIVFIAVTVVFFATYMPYFITLIISMVASDSLERMSPYHKAYYDLAKLCPLLNAISNPFIYSFTSERFRKEVSKLFTCRNCCCGKDFFRRRAFSFGSTNTINKAHELSQISE
ncbi:neuropeptide y [Plakobranchus ocellatus]|uniref:Neuropeptide y n=1 Tax=Plakobranchus ocellatus TaxID=259542 RepID=A0AAV4CGP8_9GAST|nr:neuropeptide y [Plakobranchus ocellatus]